MTDSATRPSDFAILLVMVLDGATMLDADQIRGQLKRLGFNPTTQQVAAWLGRMSREDMPCIERRTGFRELNYALTGCGRTLLDNRLPLLRGLRQKDRVMWGFERLPSETSLRAEFNGDV